MCENEYVIDNTDLGHVLAGFLLVGLFAVAASRLWGGVLSGTVGRGFK